MSLLWIRLVLAAVAAPAEPDGEPETYGGVGAPVSPFEARAQPSAEPLPVDGVKPLVRPRPEHEDPDLRPSGIAPFTRAQRPERPSTLPVDGQAPLDEGRAVDATKPVPETKPFGQGPAHAREDPPNPRTTLMTRLDFLVGPVWRVRRVDTLVSTSLEVGQMSGFSGTFHLEVIPATQRFVVRALDVPLGFGAVARGRLPGKPLYGSVGLTAGILIHRAETDGRVLHRVDPDFRLPIRFAWTIASLGMSVAVVQGYSVRNRNYESRGGIVWARHAYRVGLQVGLHWDKVVGTGKARRAGTRKRGRSSA